MIQREASEILVYCSTRKQKNPRTTRLETENIEASRHEKSKQNGNKLNIKNKIFIPF